MNLTINSKTHEAAPILPEELQALDTDEKPSFRRRSQRGWWLLFSLLLILMSAGGFYGVAMPPASLGLPSRTTLAENGITFIQNTLRASATNPAFPALALIVAFALGGLHALAPGHNKILTGVYLVGARARFRHALLIGGATAFSHTASAIIIGVLSLSVRGQIIATFYLRWLGAPSGLVVAGLGVWLLMRFLRAGRHDHPHDHPHDHSHDHSHPHAHFPIANGVTLSGLVVLGLLHGIVPTLDALAVLLVALSVERAILGVALILAYSLGIASVMSAVGMLFLSSQELLTRFRRFDRLTRWAPAVAAVTVILLGLTIVARTLGG